MNDIPALLTRLRAEIMNIPCRLGDEAFHSSTSRHLYKEGHRDARHAAVELILAFANKLEEVK